MRSGTILDLKFRREGLTPEGLSYLDHKLEGVRRDQRRKRTLLRRLREVFFPEDWGRQFLETYLEGKTLVVGCGGGLEVLGLGAVGLDIDLRALRIAVDLRRNLEDGAGAFLAADASALPLGTGTFHTVFSDNVVEHLPDARLRSHFREVARILKPGGRYVFNTPNRLFDDPVRHADHVSVHTYAEWEEYLRPAGFLDLSTPRRKSGVLGPLDWKKEMERRIATRPFRFGVRRAGVFMVVIVARR
ncbi:MAG: class I SAM-dependent methyltransferase [Candidatus Methylomirabilales bacterium]